MTRIEVTSHTNTMGKVVPVRFTWDGQETPILGIGRRWQSEDGEHILVMIPGERVVELLYSKDQTWRLKPLPGQGKHWFV